MISQFPYTMIQANQLVKNLVVCGCGSAAPEFPFLNFFFLLSFLATWGLPQERQY